MNLSPRRGALRDQGTWLPLVLTLVGAVACWLCAHIAGVFATGPVADNLGVVATVVAVLCAIVAVVGGLVALFFAGSVALWLAGRTEMDNLGVVLRSPAGTVRVPWADVAELAVRPGPGGGFTVLMRCEPPVSGVRVLTVTGLRTFQAAAVVGAGVGDAGEVAGFARSNGVRVDRG
ncbi:hypothetical protein R8Z50_06740 [Longispora sp. K20-0274]|uniref:hypothetical protein n=1 Tax=Longispora sp. K20-0274 TaxID=3088255 RepID=UPI00399B0A68